MKVFIDTNVLIDVAVRSDQFPESLKLINDLIEWDEASLWLSAISLNNIEYILSKLRHKEKARSFLKFIQKHFSIIPFRKSVFKNALDSNNQDFEDAIQMSCAQELGSSYLITRNIDDFKKSNVPVLTPKQFLEKWDAGEFNKYNQVPFLDLKAQHHQIYNEIDDRMTDVIANTGFILGKYVEEFEKGFADIQGAKYCIGVSSGTDALHVALMALGIGPGDAVAVPVNTFIATAEAVSLVGAVPVFVDCDEYYNINVDGLREVIGQGAESGGQRAESIAHRAEGKIKAIIPVHLYGQPANMDGIMALAREFGVEVVEDCCQSHLAEVHDKKVGNFGEFGAFSFYPGKNLGAYGEAGALTTNDEELFNEAKMIRQHGEIQRYHHKLIGHNYRMSAFQGAVLGVKLKYIEEWTRKRQRNAQIYNEQLEGVKGVETPGEIMGASSVYHLYVIQAEDRDGLQQYLQKNGVASGLHYPMPLHFQEAYKELGYKKGDFPVAERAAGRILSLPMYPELTEGQIMYVCDRIREFCGE